MSHYVTSLCWNHWDFRWSRSLYPQTSLPSTQAGGLQILAYLLDMEKKKKKIALPSIAAYIPSYELISLLIILTSVIYYGRIHGMYIIMFLRLLKKRVS